MSSEKFNDDRGRRKLPRQIQYWDLDEPGSVIVTLHYGWSFENGNHEGVRGFDTEAEAIEKSRMAYMCRCSECVENMKKRKIRVCTVRNLKMED